MYQQRDGAAMGSLLGPVLAGITFVGLEKCMLPKLKNHLMFLQKGMIWLLTFAKESSIEYVLQ